VIPNKEHDVKDWPVKKCRIYVSVFEARAIYIADKAWGKITDPSEPD
jgi:hypothetical protein